MLPHQPHLFAPVPDVVADTYMSGVFCRSQPTSTSLTLVSGELGVVGMMMGVNAIQFDCSFI